VKSTPGSAVAQRPLRGVLTCLVLALALALSGCTGGDDERRVPAGPLAAGLSYLRSDSAAAFVIATNLRKGAASGLDRLGSDGRRGVEAVVSSQVGQRGIPFSTAIRPQLGNPLVAGITRQGDRVAAIRVRDARQLRSAVEERLDQGQAERLDDYEGALVWKDRRPAQDATYGAAREQELVVAHSEKDVHEAIDAARGSKNLASDGAVIATLTRLGPDSLVRAVGDAQRLLESGDTGQAADARKVPWMKALGIFTLVARVEKVGEVVGVDFSLATNRVRLSKQDLPLLSGAASPRLHDPGAPASVAILEPQQLVHFLERTLGATDPDRFQRYRTGMDQLRAILRVNLHRDLTDKITSLSLAATSATAFTFEATLEPGSAPAFRRDLNRARLFVEGFVNDLAPGTTIEVRRSGPHRVWVVENRGLTLGRYSVRGGTLVGSVGPARIPPAVRGTRLPGVEGSLVLRGDLGRIGRVLGALLAIPDQAFGVVSRLGDLTLGVRAEPEALVASGSLRVGRQR
jgi:hypothetical protein